MTTLGVLDKHSALSSIKKGGANVLKNRLLKHGMRLYIGFVLVFYLCSLAGITAGIPMLIAIGIIPVTFFSGVLVIIHPGANDKQKILVLLLILISATFICILEMLMIALLRSMSEQAR